ncbi:DUF1330 domain-containing protein [Pseudorhodoferax sp.]|uniref:DUF1330 domain-containing protein n=1 Tax=Pseudorhodoferax sp. TaxID=1993553 RepID=UPI0039E3B52E
MPAYVINDMEVTDPQRFEEYKKLSPATVAQYGGRFLARGGRTEVLEGAWSPRRLVILEFPSVEQARAWIDSPEYAPARRLRQLSAVSNLILVEGAAPPA